MLVLQSNLKMIILIIQMDLAKKYNELKHNLSTLYKTSGKNLCRGSNWILHGDICIR